MEELPSAQTKLPRLLTNDDLNKEKDDINDKQSNDPSFLVKGNHSCDLRCALEKSKGADSGKCSKPGCTKAKQSNLALSMGWLFSSVPVSDFTPWKQALIKTFVSSFACVGFKKDEWRDGHQRPKKSREARVRAFYTRYNWQNVMGLAYSIHMLMMVGLLLFYHSDPIPCNESVDFTAQHSHPLPSSQINATSLRLHILGIDIGHDCHHELFDWTHVIPLSAPSKTGCYIDNV
jgi:hypothetical protein